MTKERLSQLQKWVLTEAYKRGEREVHFKTIRERCYYLEHSEIYKGYLASNIYKSVVLCNSLKRLKEKRLIEHKAQYWGTKNSTVILTDSGIEMAKSLLLITRNINNKEKEAE